MSGGAKKWARHTVYEDRRGRIVDHSSEGVIKIRLVDATAEAIAWLAGAIE